MLQERCDKFANECKELKDAMKSRTIEAEETSRMINDLKRKRNENEVMEENIHV